jgi:hypothetical protein
MNKFRKRPVVIDAVQWTGKNVEEIRTFTNNKGHVRIEVEKNEPVVTNFLSILTMEGEMTASIGDWIIKGVEGEFYPCKPDIFYKTYEKIEE